MAGITADRFLRVNFRSVVSLHLPTLVLMFAGIVILYFLKFDRYFVLAFIIVWAMDLLPALYLHIAYLFVNYGEEYVIRSTELIRRKGGTIAVYRNSEIDKIIVYLSPALYKGSNFHLLAIEGYHYAIVKLKTGDELFLTCLLAPRIDRSLQLLRGVLFEKRKCLFCSV